MDRPTIAMLGNQFGPYQKLVTEYAQLRLEREGYCLTFVSGGPLKPTRDWNEEKTVLRNQIYPMSRNYAVDGYLILATAIGQHASAGQLSAFTEQFMHKPLVCIGYVDAPVVSVLVDNYNAMVSLMEHMTQDRSRQRFAYMSGWSDSSEACERLSAFRDVLASKEISIDEQLIIEGKHRRSTGYFAMDKLLHQTTDIDVVVAANDLMAQGAIHALSKHGLRVPTDVIVSGFDDGAVASTTFPPLTTMSYSLEEIINVAVDQLLLQIKSGQCFNKTKIHVPSRLIIRASSDKNLVAGCRNTPDSASEIFDAQKFSDLLLDNLRTIKTPQGLSSNEVVSDIVSLLVNGNMPGDSCLFDSLAQLKDRPQDVYWWKHLHLQICEALKYQGNVGLSSDALGFTASILGQVHLATWNVESTREVSTSLIHELFYELRSKFNAVTNFEEFTIVLDFIEARMPVTAGFVCLYDQKEGYSDEYAKVVYAAPHIRGGLDFDYVFKSCEVLPSSFVGPLFSGPFLVEPLCIGSTHLGYMVLNLAEMGERERLNPKALAELITGALWRCMTSV